MPSIRVIEDELEFREPPVKILKNDGHTVTVAADGVEAMKLLDTLRPDFIITDLLMPKMDGIEVIMELSRSGSGVPIIAMCGGRRSVTIQQAVATPLPGSGR